MTQLHFSSRRIELYASWPQKGQFKNWPWVRSNDLTWWMTQVDHIVYQSMPLMRQPQWHLAYVSAFVLWGVISINVFVMTMTSYMMTSYDLPGVNGQQLHLIHCQIASRRGKLDLSCVINKKRLKGAITANILIKLVVTWPPEQGHSSATKGHSKILLAHLV